MQNGMQQRVNVNAHRVVRINVKTWYGRIFVMKNRSWLLNSSFWRETVVLNNEIWGKTEKNSCALYITSKLAKTPIFRAHNLKYLKILTWEADSHSAFRFYVKNHSGNDPYLFNNKTLQTFIIKKVQIHLLMAIINKTIYEFEILNKTIQVDRYIDIIQDYFSNSHMNLCKCAVVTTG